MLAQVEDHARDDILPFPLVLEDTIAVSEAAVCVGEHTLFAALHRNSTHLANHIFCLHTIRPHILHRRGTYLARDMAQVLQSVEPHVGYLRYQVVHHDTCAHLYVDAFGILLQRAGKADTRVEHHTIKVFGKQKVRACTYMQQTLALIGLQERAQLLQGSVFRIYSCVSRNTKGIWD